jgi:hypothetical protein
MRGVHGLEGMRGEGAHNALERKRRPASSGVGRLDMHGEDAAQQRAHVRGVYSHAGTAC